jgi:hypothetical protein
MKNKFKKLMVDFYYNNSDIATIGWTDRPRQVVLSYATEIIAGKPLIPRPSLPEPHYTAKQIADELGVSANRIGRIAKQHNLKTEEYGKWILDKAKHCDKQVRTFIYNEKGKQKLLEVLNHQ